MKISIYSLVNLVAVCFLSACGSSVARPEKIKSVQTLDQKLDLSAVKVGASRDDIEKVLGQPMSISESERGLECMYMLGLGGFRMPTAGSMAGMQAMGTAQSLVGMAGGLAGPAGGVIGGVASEVIGIGSSLAAQSAMPAMPDPSQIRMVMVGYRDGKAISINRINPGAMGGAPIDQ